jgi:hypothetical protein
LAFRRGTGTHNIQAFYSGDSIHSGSGLSPIFILLVNPATVVLSTSPIAVQTGQPVNASGVFLGLSVFDRASLIGGFPTIGATFGSATVTYLFYPNGKCTAGTSTFSSTFPVGLANNVHDSSPVTPDVTGDFSFNAVYNNDTQDNNRVTSACAPFTVVPAPGFTAGKLHWTHHLSLSKSASTQSWTAIVTNPLSTSANVVVRIVGSSTINPSLTFDVTCGAICVNTNLYASPTAAALAAGPHSVAAGTSSDSFSFNQAIPSSFVNQKLTFTATVYWQAAKISTLYIPGTSKSGSFAVVP